MTCPNCGEYCTGKSQFCNQPIDEKGTSSKSSIHFKAQSLSIMKNVDFSWFPDGTFHGYAHGLNAITEINGWFFIIELGLELEGPCRITSWSGDITIQMEGK